jgi:hypothetical protein
MNELLTCIDQIDQSVNDAEINVLEALIGSYDKALVILQECEVSDYSSFEIFQEGEILDAAKGSSDESIIKRILLFIPRLIKALVKKAVAFVKNMISKLKKVEDNIPDGVEMSDDYKLELYFDYNTPLLEQIGLDEADSSKKSFSLLMKLGQCVGTLEGFLMFKKDKSGLEKVVLSLYDEAANILRDLRKQKKTVNQKFKSSDDVKRYIRKIREELTWFKTAISCEFPDLDMSGAGAGLKGLETLSKRLSEAPITNEADKAFVKDILEKLSKTTTTINTIVAEVENYVAMDIAEVEKQTGANEYGTSVKSASEFDGKIIAIQGELTLNRLRDESEPFMTQKKCAMVLQLDHPNITNGYSKNLAKKLKTLEKHYSDKQYKHTVVLALMKSDNGRLESSFEAGKIIHCNGFDAKLAEMLDSNDGVFSITT